MNQTATYSQARAPPARGPPVARLHTFSHTTHYSRWAIADTMGF